mmetsp:Transcript_45695/g.126686  ORF Transcript_45695/g.126686 Transcript_45695/m.126686 type:complete len:136 (-) Transcript_45695:873-1280(-)
MTVEMKEKHREEHVTGKKKSLKKIVKRNERSKDEDAGEDEAVRKKGTMDNGNGKKGKEEKKRPGRGEDDDMDMRGDEDMEMEMDEHGGGKRGGSPKGFKSKRRMEVADVDENTPTDVLMDGPSYASPRPGPSDEH